MKQNQFIFAPVPYKGKLFKLEFDAILGVWVAFVRVDGMDRNVCSVVSFHVLHQNIEGLLKFLNKEIEISLQVSVSEV